MRLPLIVRSRKYARAGASAALLLTVILPHEAKAATPQVVFSSAATNDLYQALVNTTGLSYGRYNDPLSAVTNAPVGSGVMILADGYPQFTTAVQQQVFTLAQQKNLRLYIEYPQSIPGLSLASPQLNGVERLVVDDNTFFGSSLQTFDLLDAHEASFVRVNSNISNANQLVRKARVAGYETAVFGYSGVTTQPALFSHSNNGVNMLVSTTKLSNFVTGRFLPNQKWESFWNGVFSWIDPASDAVNLAWTPLLQPTFNKTEALPAGARAAAIGRGIDWYSNLRLLIHPDWHEEYVATSNLADIAQPWPHASHPVGDGSLGVLEGTANPIYGNGEQAIRWFVRNDVVGPSAMAFAFHGVVADRQGSKDIAANLINHIHNSPLSSGGKSNPNNIAFGLRGWNETSPYNNIYWADDNARQLLGQVTTSALLDTPQWDEWTAIQTLSMFRLTGVTGFWGANAFSQGGLDSLAEGWQTLHNRSVNNPAPHFEAYKWANFLWLYDKTEYEPLLERTKAGIEITMNAFNNGTIRWTNGLQQERARMLLPLAWLVRAEDTPQHRAWLVQMVNAILANQDESGALREELGPAGFGLYPAPSSNAAFGTNEAPVIQNNGDPGVDLLYTANFALKGLIEAAAVLNDPAVDLAVTKMADFMLRTQVTSSTDEYDGAWLRAFDYERWDYWGSDSDAGWGTLGTQAGWTQAEIISSLALLEMDTNLWDLTADSQIDQIFNPVLNHMLELGAHPYDLNFDGVFDVNDWKDVMQPNLSRDVSGFSALVARSLGDLDGNGRVNLFDFRLFKQAYEAAYGANAFAHDLNNVVPEPPGPLLLVVAIAFLIGLCRFKPKQAIPFIVL